MTISRFVIVHILPVNHDKSESFFTPHIRLFVLINHTYNYVFLNLYSVPPST